MKWVKPIRFQCIFSLPTENIRKPYGFQGVEKGYIGNEWVEKSPKRNYRMNPYFSSQFLDKLPHRLNLHFSSWFFSYVTTKKKIHKKLESFLYTVNLYFQLYNSSFERKKAIPLQNEILLTHPRYFEHFHTMSWIKYVIF